MSLVFMWSGEVSHDAVVLRSKLVGRQARGVPLQHVLLPMSASPQVSLPPRVGSLRWHCQELAAAVAATAVVTWVSSFRPRASGSQRQLAHRTAAAATSVLSCSSRLVSLQPLVRRHAQTGAQVFDDAEGLDDWDDAEVAPSGASGSGVKASNASKRLADRGRRAFGKSAQGREGRGPRKPTGPQLWGVTTIESGDDWAADEEAEEDLDNLEEGPSGAVECLLELFRVYDFEKTGSLEPEMIRKVVGKLGNELSETQVEKRIRAADTGTGRVDYVAFLKDL